MSLLLNKQRKQQLLNNQLIQHDVALAEFCSQNKHFIWQRELPSQIPRSVRLGS